ncbi:hypothetical protein VTN00DRAFT_9599 [Thermoascus crustaceus]|uniref:uncharacterized protein n=1 Tax=Thermoascus crustaceus TaxID=5088 RepID=UPI00374378AE
MDRPPLVLPLFALAAPEINTRAALLLLDLQNDFVRPWGRLPVANVADFLDALPALTASFRRAGDVIWVHSRFEERRPLVDPDSGADLLVLDATAEDASGDRREGEERVDDEAFLSTETPCCLPDSDGSRLPAPVCAALDADRDMVTVKSHYSALRCPHLVLTLRTRLVTDLYLAGSLSNVSVYATALDAVRHGFTVTVLEDCLGFRSFARHAEAMRRMADILGVNGTTVSELLDEADEMAEEDDTARAAATPAGLEGGMGHLGVQGSPAQDVQRPPPRRVPQRSQEEIEAERDRQRRIWEEMEARRDDPESMSPIEVEEDEAAQALQDYRYPRARKDRQGRTLDRAPLISRGPRDPKQKSSSKRHVPRVRRAKPPDPAGAASAPRQASAGGPAASPPRASSARTEQPPPPPLLPPAPTQSTQPPERTEPPEPEPEPEPDPEPQDQEQPPRKKRADGSLGPGDRIGEGDSRIVYDLDLPPDAFQRIRAEVEWQKMYHLSGQVPRLVAVQGHVQPDGSVPIYRHPADESPPLRPWTPTVDRVRAAVERALGHPLNHALIQLYRDGQDRISEHADKTLDIVRGSCICNVSLGAQRTMVLRTKVSSQPQQPPPPPPSSSSSGDDAGRRRQTQRVPMPHRSLFIMGERTNARWLHGIRPDRRPETAKTAEERAFGGERISLTFRHIGTFVHPAAGTIWGQGAVSKTQERAGRIIHGDPGETERLIRAFGRENHETEPNWEEVYGGGFDVVNFVTTSAAKLILSGDPVADLRVRLCLTENGLRYEIADPATLGPQADTLPRPLYVASDGTTTVAGDIQTLSYMAQPPPEVASRQGGDHLRGGSRLPQIQALFVRWRQYRASKGRSGEVDGLADWEKALQGQHYLEGQVFGIDDCAFWPLLREIVQETGPFSSTRFPALQTYYQRVEKRGCVRAVVDEMRGDGVPGGAV